MLTLRYKVNTSVPVEVEGITPTAVRGKSLSEIERLAIFHGNQKPTLAEFFDVTGDAADGRMAFEGNLAGVHWIGAQMSDGEIHVHGDAGRHVGSEMTGGVVHVHGNAGDWVGGEMHGGVIHVRGNAGHLVGSAYRGSRHGMTGGTILVGGSAGNEVGHTMRRGLVLIGGGCGDFLGFSMIAGTVLVFGECGNRPAAGIRRGTVGLLGDNKPPAILGTFRKGSVCRPLYLQLVFRYVRSLGFAVDDQVSRAPYRLYHGDNVTVGKGELLVRESAVHAT
jgi:formylmethanofuran dehydrogenase subunit C